MDAARAHLDGIRALLAADERVTVLDDGDAPPAGGLAVYVGEAADDAPPIYAVVTVSTPRGEGQRLSADTPLLACRAAVLHSGTTQREVLWAVGITQDALRRKRPPAPGRRCTPLKGGNGQPRLDASTTPSSWAATDTWQFSSTPAEETP